MDWVEGRTLDRYVEDHLSNPAALRDISTKFYALVIDLNSNGISHGDLQNGNIIVDTYGRLRLVDYDNVFVPGLEKYLNTTEGYPSFQHPNRNTVKFLNPKIDYFSHLIIYLSLLALAEDAELEKPLSLWERFRNRDDTQLLFNKSDYKSLRSSDIFSTLSKMSDEVRRLTGHLANFCREEDPTNLLPLDELLSRPHFTSSESLRNDLHPDHWAEIDYLGYERYAHAIEHIITDSDSAPPLTIGIFGPWGQGKTTLLRYVERRFQKKKKTNENFKNGRKPQYKDIKNWEEEEDQFTSKEYEYPCIWFNPWEYQSSEQIWAGMAHAIISQIVKTLPPIAQSEFWLKLHLKRIDTQAIKRDLVRTTLTRLLPEMIIFSLSFFLACVLIIAKIWDGYWYLPVIMGAGSIFEGIYAGTKSWTTGYKEEFEKYIYTPNYEEEQGSYHHVNEDLERVFGLLVSEKSPTLIFIDDLDRCSPKVVVEVIEAINLMMNAKFRNKCYFIIGMDPEMVAASIDVAYDKMAGRIPEKEKSMGSVGWYFLDKFIQLPFMIPTMNFADKEKLVRKLFEYDGQLQKDTKTPKGLNIEEVKAVEAKAVELKATNEEEERKEKVDEMSYEEERLLDEIILTSEFKEQRLHPDIEKEVIKYARYLDPSPRSIKRFANLLRFHNSHQNLRRLKGKEHAALKTLAVLLIISLRWPLLVRWIQWQSEEKIILNDGKRERLFFSKNPIQKAELLDQMFSWIHELPMEKAYKRWREFGLTNTHLPWLLDKDLFSICYQEKQNDFSFSHALEARVW